MALVPRKTYRLLRYVVALFIGFVFLTVVIQQTKESALVPLSDKIAASKDDDGGIIKKKTDKFEVEVPDIPGLQQAAGIIKSETAKKDWMNHTQVKEDIKRIGPGEHGLAYHMPKNAEDEKKKGELFGSNGFNALASDHIALNRSVKDLRHPKCKTKLYLEKLPTVSVILPFHNEHWSTLLRSVYSIIDRSPPELLKEVILADDFSSKDFLKTQLDEHIHENWGKSGKVKVVRAKKREGLIRARLLGAKAATGEVIVFLDSHSECNYNWLPPLLEPIVYDYRTAVCPFVDIIDYETFEYRPQDEGARGAWDWELYYKRLSLLPEDIRNMPEPFKSPVMAGGYFAINAKWFWELGGYDEGLDVWGGEQYELSFKLWQCGGQMVDAPCSRVGHIYRKFAPFGNPGFGDFIGKNYKRVAEVWMDEYAEYIYKRRPHYKNLDAGDLTQQKAVRERLKCKSFKWFMENVAFDQPEKYPPVEPPDGATGEIRNVAANKCIDTRFKGANQRFELKPCLKDYPEGGGEQSFQLTYHKDIRPRGRNLCFDVSQSIDRAPVVLFECHGMHGNQLWKYRLDSRQLYHPTQNLCMDADPERGEIYMRTCESAKASQQWSWEKVDKELVARWNANIR